MARIPVALQLFSVRGECEKDLPGALKSVADIGYVGAEPWGYTGESPEWLGWTGKDVRKMFDDNGLTCCGIHLATGALLGDNLQRTIDLNAQLGNRFLVIAADKPRMSSYDSIMELAGILNRTAEKLTSHGMFTGYHAHPFDFVKIEGKTAWDILFSNTDDGVIMQLDIGNSAGGGGDPVGILKRFPGRARSVHLKDYGGAPGCVIGEGDAEWEEIFRLCETEHETEWYVVEEGDARGLGFGTSTRSLKALQAMGK